VRFRVASWIMLFVVGFSRFIRKTGPQKNHLPSLTVELVPLLLISRHTTRAAN